MRSFWGHSTKKKESYISMGQSNSPLKIKEMRKMSEELITSSRKCKLPKLLDYVL
jgi:hypothetical protein